MDKLIIWETLLLLLSSSVSAFTTFSQLGVFFSFLKSSQCV